MATLERERIVFEEEVTTQQHIKIIVSGIFDETMLEALEDYVKHKRIQIDAIGEN